MQDHDTTDLCVDCGAPLKDYRSTRCNPCRGAMITKEIAEEFEEPNPSGFCMCGCGNKTKQFAYSSRRYGVAKGWHHRYLPGHHSTKSPIEYTVDPASGCWIWQKQVNRNGYGVTSRNKRKTLAHRAMYEMLRGPIPEGMSLDHICSVPRCVNPDHLEPVTHRENVHRGRATKLSDADVKRLREVAPNHSYKELAEMFGISPAHASRIVRGTAR